MRTTTAELDISEGDYGKAGQKLLRRHDDPDVRPESTWNDITTPGPGKFYERYWRYEIDQEDRYPAYRGHDTPATRAMRFAVDAPARGRNSSSIYESPPIPGNRAPRPFPRNRPAPKDEKTPHSKNSFGRRK